MTTVACEKVRWAFRLSRWTSIDKNDWFNALCCLQREERQRIREFKYLRSAKASLVGRLFIRKFAKCYLDFPNNDEIVILRSKHGRPFINNNPNLNYNFDFNVSHHGDFVVFAANYIKVPPDENGEKSQIRLGIDVMRFSEKPGLEKDFFRLMRRKFTASEWDFVMKRRENGTKSRKESEEEEEKDFLGFVWFNLIRQKKQSGRSLFSGKLCAFYRLWCLKESFVKADGRGLSWDLQKIEFQISSSDIELNKNKLATSTKLFLDGKEEMEWLFAETLLDHEHCVCVASNQPSSPHVEDAQKFLVFDKTADLINNLEPFKDLDLSPDCEWLICQNMDKTP